MKYLKTINESWVRSKQQYISKGHKFDIDKVVLECKDILMELVDDGIEVSVYEAVNNTISVNIESTTTNNINYSKIKSNIEHLLSYMSEDFDCELYSAGSYKQLGDMVYYKSLEEIEEEEDNIWEFHLDHLCFLFHF